MLEGLPVCDWIDSHLMPCFTLKVYGYKLSFLWRVEQWEFLVGRLLRVFIGEADVISALQNDYQSGKGFLVDKTAGTKE